jgi:DNA segregation ATPase FtsK/SpoIIIE, S-DNA-T family
MAQVRPDDAHFYVFDGGGGLAALSALPHCGAVVTSAEPDRADRLLARLASELTRRTRLLSSGGYGDLAEYRQAQHGPDAPPFLLVFIDRYDAFVTAIEQIDHGRLVEQLQRLIRDGPSAGLRVVATGDRTLLTGKLAALAEDRIVLRMADRTDYGLVGLNTRSVPVIMPSGRGLRLPEGELLQVALVSADAQGQRRTASCGPVRDAPDDLPSGRSGSIRCPSRSPSSRPASCLRRLGAASSWAWAATISARCGWRHPGSWSSARQVRAAVPRSPFKPARWRRLDAP